MTITLTTLPQATAQEVFDQVSAHLLRQKRKSLEDGKCRYKGPGNLRCAAGCLISDSEYRQEMEGQSWSDLISDGWVPDTHESLICELQDIHDAYSVHKWKEELKETSEHYNLIFKEPT